MRARFDRRGEQYSVRELDLATGEYKLIYTIDYFDEHTNGVGMFETDDGDFYPFGAFGGYLCRFDDAGKVCYDDERKFGVRCVIRPRCKKKKGDTTTSGVCVSVCRAHTRFSRREREGAREKTGENARRLSYSKPNVGTVVKTNYIYGQDLGSDEKGRLYVVEDIHTDDPTFSTTSNFFVSPDLFEDTILDLALSRVSLLTPPPRQRALSLLGPVALSRGFFLSLSLSRRRMSLSCCARRRSRRVATTSSSRTARPLGCT